eukprot:scaffold2327_cov149-Amphora_coffeaeformis.AAC.5
MSEIKKKDSFIPLFLQQKLQKDKGEAPVDGSPGTRRHGSQRQRRSAASDFTAPQLEDLIWKTSQTIVELQKQIQRGEETYYEETQTHGSSLYRGFETFIDARDVGTSSAPQASSRRMPGDFRWFSSSCSNISRHMKQRPFVPVAPPPAPNPSPPAPDGNSNHGSEQPTTAEPVSGQKRPAPPVDPEAANSPPTKERRVDESKSSQPEDDMKTPKEDKSSKGGRSASTPKSTEPRRRTSRKRKA